jgi:AcrR family transcriptional regulator
MSSEKGTAEKIMDAAINLFAKKGFAAVSVKELAQTAGVNIALISYYFGGKENLYAMILERQFAISANAIESIKKEKLTPIEKIRRFADLMVELHKDTSYVDKLIYSEIINPTGCFDKIVRKAAAKIHCFLKDCICEAITEGLFRPDLDPDYAASFLCCNIHFYFITQPISMDLLPARDDQAAYYVSQAIETYLKGVLNSTPQK